MIRIKTPVEPFPHWAQTDIRDSDGTVLASCASGHEGEMIAGEIKRALNERDDLIAQRDALVGAREAFIDVLDKSPGDLELLQFVARLASIEEKARAALDLVKGEQ